MLSILICTMPSRARQLGALMAALEPQVKKLPVEILVESDSGEMTVGEKRNLLMGKAKGEYIAYVDDDDMVDSMYVALILGAIQSGKKPDCVGMCGYIVENRQRTWQFRHSITVTNWCKDKKKRIYFRTPNHLNPIRAEFARQVVFPQKSWGEDRDYSDRIRPYLHTEQFIERPIYFYQMGNK